MEFWANVATLVALIPTIVALLMTVWQLRAGRHGSSAASVVSLNESLRQAWLHFRSANGEEDIQYAFSDVINLLEIACAANEDGLFVGETGKIMKKYLVHVLQAVAQDASAKQRIEKMLEIPGTFQHIYRFVLSNRKDILIKLPAEE